MHQYATARTLFGLLEFLAWVAIVIAGCVALFSFFGGIAAGELGILIGLWVALPALVVVFVAILCLVLVQTGRAGVDTAKATHELLEIAKKQLRMAESVERDQERQELVARAGSAKPESHAILDTKHWQVGKPDQAPEATVAAKSYAPSPGPEPTRPEKLTYQGVAIEMKPDGAFIYGQRFRDLDAAKLHIEREGVYGSPHGHRLQLTATPAGLG